MMRVLVTGWKMTYILVTGWEVTCVLVTGWEVLVMEWEVRSLKVV